ncbi:MAG: hypothetical protein GY853_06665 [PVC group bacterium]|nr:hypothetical protein [PVC group bacterium]
MDDETKIKMLRREIVERKENYMRDNQFMIIALNLTGDPKRFENEAFDLINKNGYIKALKISKQSKDNK